MLKMVKVQVTDLLCNRNDVYEQHNVYLVSLTKMKLGMQLRKEVIEMTLIGWSVMKMRH